MDSLPNEIVLQVATYLSAAEVIAMSVASRHFQFLTRDRHHWRERCYYESKVSAQKRREDLIAHQSSRTAALRQAVNQLSQSSSATAVMSGLNGTHVNHQGPPEAGRPRMVSWDPSYPSKKVDFYQEYVHRHAPIRLSWFEGADGRARSGRNVKEAVGASVLYDSDGRASKLYAPVDDGSIAVWEAHFPAQGTADHEEPGRQLASSSKGVLCPESSTIRLDGAGMGCISIDQPRHRGFFASANDLVEVDLETLQRISRHSFAWPISALSEARSGMLLTVGTTYDLHLMDPRLPENGRSSADVSLLGGSPNLTTSNNAEELLNSPSSGPRRAHLPQPGPLSIIYPSQSHNNHSIWVAGNFTHLLNYDMRYFPRLSGTIHSGARISSLTSLPYSCVTHPGNGASRPSRPAFLDSANGTTIVAAGAYKGKGSLEMYSFSGDHASSSLDTEFVESSGRALFSMTGTGTNGICVKNRQTASSTKLLSVANHGLKVTYSDGNAMIKWVERDGLTSVREFSVSSASPQSAAARADQYLNFMTDGGLWGRNSDFDTGDVVQKLIPTLHPANVSGAGQSLRLHEDNLIIWTADGRLGMLGFGKHSGWDEQLWEERAELADEEYARLEAERAQAIRMRQALQWQADEARFMQGMGLPFVSR